MKTALLVSLGSAIGGFCRYGLSTLLQRGHHTGFPLGTFVVNILGCFLIGLLTGFALKGNVSPYLRSFLGMGVLGGFTTFSAFSNESVTLFRSGQITTALLYVSASATAGLLCSFAGFALVSRTSML